MAILEQTYKTELTLRKNKTVELTHGELDGNFEALAENTGKSILLAHTNDENSEVKEFFAVTVFTLTNEQVEAMKNIDIVDSNYPIGYVEYNEYSEVAGENNENVPRNVSYQAFIYARTEEDGSFWIDTNTELYLESEPTGTGVKYMVGADIADNKLFNAKVVFFDKVKNNGIYPNTDLSYEIVQVEEMLS